MRNLCALTWQHYMKSAPGLRGLYPRPKRRGFTPLLVRYDEVHRHRLFYFETHLSVPYFNRSRCQDEQNQNYE